MYLFTKIFLSLVIVVNSEKAKEPVIDEEFCNKKLEEYKQKVPNIITAYQKIYKRLSWNCS